MIKRKLAPVQGRAHVAAVGGANGIGDDDGAGKTVIGRLRLGNIDHPARQAQQSQLRQAGIPEEASQPPVCKF
jgi:hypothetical protein